MAPENIEKIKEQNGIFKKLLLALAVAIVIISAVTVTFGLKYKNQKAEVAGVKASVEKIQSELDNINSEKEANQEQNAQVIESYKDALNEQSSSFEDEKNRLNKKINELNKQIALKKKLQEEASQNNGQQQQPPSFNTGGKKTVYLTFDDGPSSNTPKILQILKDNGVRATFFVINGGKYNKYMKNIVDEGHQIALHTYSHDYAKIYASDKAYFNDLDKISDLVYAQTGVRSDVIRFPGGSSNTVSKKYSAGIMSRLTKQVEEKGYHYFDWNVSSGDATGNKIPVSTLLSNCRQIPKSNTVIILLHDTNSKNTTVEALPEIIAYYKSVGCSFGVITANTPAIHQRVNN